MGPSRSIARFSGRWSSCAVSRKNKTARRTSEARARQDYREWAEGQHRLWVDYEGKFGMDDAAYAAAIARAAEEGRDVP